MPKVKTNCVKYPEGWELIEPTLRELQAKMREGLSTSEEPIYFRPLPSAKGNIKELYEFCLDQGYADRNLTAKWKKPGYERLCCLRCMQPRDHNFATNCVCRVLKHLSEEKVIEFVHCGCRGCASAD